MIQWRKDIIARKDRVAIPVMTHPGIEELGYTVKQAVTNGEIHAKAVEYLANRYPSHAASVIMDLTVEAEAFGAEVLFPEDEIPTVTGHMLDNAQDIHNLNVPSLNSGRIREYVKANLIAHRAVQNISNISLPKATLPIGEGQGERLGGREGALPLFAGCIGPFSLAGRLYDMSEIMVLTYSDPEAAHELLEKCTLFILKYITALKATGIEGVLMAEPAAGLLSNDDCKTFSSKYVKRIVDALQDESFMIILHNCGNTGHCTEAMVQTGAHGLHLGNKCDLAEIAKDCPDDILVMGNLDPVTAFKQSTPEEMYNKTMDLLESTKQFPNVVLSSGCDTPPHTPLANVDAFYKALQDYNNR